MPAGQWRRRGTVAVMLAPSATGLVLFTLTPVVLVAAWSLTRYDLFSPPHYIGLQNYRFAAESDPYLHQAIGNTVWMMVVGIPVQLIVALSLALLLARPGRTTAATRTAMFLPSVLPPVAATLTFGWLLKPGQGLVDHVLKALNLPQPLWFSDPQLAKPGLVLLGIWGIGPTAILYIGGLVRIPRTLYESALLEGAGPWRRFRSITIPMLTPVLLFTVIVGIVGAMQYFTEALIASSRLAPPGSDGLSGAPQGSLRFYSTWLFRQAFDDLHLGYAAMLAWLMFLAALVLIGLLLVVVRRYSSAEHRA